MSAIFKQVDGITAEVTINHAGESKVITSNGNGRLDAVSNAIKQYFNISYELSFYEEHSLTKDLLLRLLLMWELSATERHSGV